MLRDCGFLKNLSDSLVLRSAIPVCLNTTPLSLLFYCMEHMNNKLNKTVESHKWK